MTKDEAAKLAQAYQWLSEGKDVEYSYERKLWMAWDGYPHVAHDYRIKPEPLLECWANVYAGGHRCFYSSAEIARAWGNTGTGEEPMRIAVPMREVCDEPTT